VLDIFYLKLQLRAATDMSYFIYLSWFWSVYDWVYVSIEV